MLEGGPQPFVAIAAGHPRDDVHSYHPQGYWEAQRCGRGGPLGWNMDQAGRGEVAGLSGLHDPPGCLEQHRGGRCLSAELALGELDRLRVERGLTGPAVERVVTDIGLHDRVHAGFVDDEIARLVDEDRAVGLHQIACADNDFGRIRARSGAVGSEHVIPAREAGPDPPGVGRARRGGQGCSGSAIAIKRPIQGDEGLPCVVIEGILRRRVDETVLEDRAEIRLIVGEIRTKLVVRGTHASLRGEVHVPGRSPDRACNQQPRGDKDRANMN